LTKESVMSYILVYIYLFGCGMILTGKSRVCVDWLRSVRYEFKLFKLLALFAMCDLLRGAVFMMQARRYKAILRAAESFLKNALAVQVLDDSNPDFGGLRCPDLLVCEPWAAANAFTTMTILFFNQDSQFYRSSELFQRMKIALRFINQSQYEDGTIDAYFSGEMRAASNVAFAILSLVKAHKLFHKEAANGEMLEHLEQRLVDRARGERCTRLMVLALDCRQQHRGRYMDVFDNSLDGDYVIRLGFQYCQGSLVELVQEALNRVVSCARHFAPHTPLCCP